MAICLFSYFDCDLLNIKKCSIEDFEILFGIKKDVRTGKYVNALMMHLIVFLKEVIDEEYLVLPNK